MIYSREEAQDMLNVWIEAEKAVATGQSYKIGTRTLTRASLPEIAKRIEYWVKILQAIDRGTKGIRVQRAVLRDF